MLRSAILVYDGTSKTALKLKAKTWQEALASTRKFVAACSSVTIPEEVQIEVFKGPAAPREFWTKAKKILNKHFDRFFPYERADDADWDPQGKLRWSVPHEELDAAVEVCQSLRPFPDVSPYDSVALGVSWKLRLIDPQTKTELPHQDPEEYGGKPINVFGQQLGVTTLYLRMGPKTPTLYWFLCAPFEDPADTAFLKLVRFWQRHFPATMLPKHWKRWKLSKKGTGYGGDKIEVTV
jgi:hypothetical protein